MASRDAAEVAKALTLLGSAYRGDWSLMDGRTLRDELGELASVLKSETGTFDAAVWAADGGGICPEKGCWFQYCDEQPSGDSTNLCAHAKAVIAQRDRGEAPARADKWHARLESDDWVALSDDVGTVDCIARDELPEVIAALAAYADGTALAEALAAAGVVSRLASWHDARVDRDDAPRGRCWHLVTSGNECTQMDHGRVLALYAFVADQASYEPVEGGGDDE